ncbi:MAG TPA: hypothetical protein VK801_04130 [Caulobacteraceae bacterium]|nr:hypothetical protein [Caulobacteraceae bacterium]
MLDVVGIVFIGVTLAVLLTAIITSLPLSSSARLILAGAAGAWVSLAVGVVSGGGLSNLLNLLVMFGTPLLVAAALALLSPAARRLAGAVPTPMLIGLNVFRVLGVLFVLLAAAGRLAGPFPYSAGWGDVVTGVLAVPAAWAATRETRRWDGLLLAWNAFGMLDLIVAVALGVTSRNGSPVQLIHAGVGTAAITTLPWALIPTVLVPFFLIDHAVIFTRLLARRPSGSIERQAPFGALGAARR